MPRGPRIDYSGALHHVVDRGAAKRTIFETAADVRRFQALVARTVRAGLLEVHAFSLLTTHYHLLVGSPLGRLPEAMWSIQNGYVRWFNRGRCRDGPLMHGRYFSRRIESAAYFRAVVRYIDRNPANAGIVSAPHLYPHGSAWHYCRGRRPPWLRTDAVEALACDRASREEFRPELYPAFAALPCDAATALVDARLRAPPADSDPLDDLVRSAPLQIQRWMQQKAALADGTRPGIVLLSARSLLATIDEEGLPDPPLTSLRAGLLRGLCGLTIDALSKHLGCAPGVASRAARAHRAAVLSDPAYAAMAAEIVHTVIRRDFGPPGRLFDLPRRLPDAAPAIDLPERGFLVDVER